MIRPCQCMFRKGRSLSLWLHFRFHFGVVLGAQFLTILLFGRPDGRNRVKKKVAFFCTPFPGVYHRFLAFTGYFVRRVLARVCAHFRGWKNQEGSQKGGQALKCGGRGHFFCALLHFVSNVRVYVCFLSYFSSALFGERKRPL